MSDQIANSLFWDNDDLPIDQSDGKTTAGADAPAESPETQDEPVKIEIPAKPDITEINEDLIAQYLNPISKWMDDPDVIDIMIYSKNRVYIRKRGSGFFRDPTAQWRQDKDLITAVKNIGHNVGRTIGNREPILDARLPDKSRVNAICEPCYYPGSCISIRKFPEQHFTLDDLERFGAIDRNGHKLLEIIMRYGRNVLIAGSTGSGKTTLLNSLCAFIPAGDVVVTVEDSREISIPCELWSALETKRAADKEDTEVTLRELIKNSLRQNPQWVIVGEVRGDEAFDLLRAFNTGHHGAGTIHANSAADALDALETLILFAKELPIRAVKGLISRSINIVIHMTVLPDYSRVLSEIIEIEGLDNDVSPDYPPYKIRSLYEYEFDRYDENGKAVGRFVVKDPPSWVHKLKMIPNLQVPDFWRENNK